MECAITIWFYVESFFSCIFSYFHYLLHQFFCFSSLSTQSHWNCCYHHNCGFLTLSFASSTMTATKTFLLWPNNYFLRCWFVKKKIFRFRSLFLGLCVTAIPSMHLIEILLCNFSRLLLCSFFTPSGNFVIRRFVQITCVKTMNNWIIVLLLYNFMTWHRGTNTWVETSKRKK